MANMITSWTNVSYTTLVSDGANITSCTDYFETQGKAYTNLLGLSEGEDYVLTINLTKNNEDTYLKVKINQQTNGVSPVGSTWTSLSAGVNTINYTAATGYNYLLLWKESNYSEPDFSATFDLSLPATGPTLTTHDAFDITTNSCTFSGTVESSGSLPITERGFCYIEGTSVTPTLEEEGVVVVSGTGSFDVGSYSLPTVEALLPNTTYSFRAYAIDGDGVGYGDVLYFTTQMEWAVKTYNVEEGDVLKWQYIKDDSVDAGADAGYLDSVSMVSAKPTITFKLRNYISLPGMTLKSAPAVVTVKKNQGE